MIFLSKDALQTQQTINNFVSVVCSLLIFGYIIWRILWNYTSLTHYQNLLVCQATVGIISSVLRLITNRTATIEMTFQYGYSFLEWPPSSTKLLISILITLVAAEAILLAIFNIHRVLIFTKPSRIRIFYIITTPLSVSYLIMAGTINFFLNKVFKLCFYTLYLFIPVIIFTCYFTLRRHFRMTHYTDRIRKLQNKMSNGLLIQVILHFVAIALLASVDAVITPSSRIFALKNENTVVIGKSYALAIYMLLSWYPVFIGFIIKWSISGFLTKNKVTRPKTTLILPVISQGGQIRP
uniref:G_PROTEIN_RECEP_F1_2 domain-containing protein n=1 Tax=Haemonchus contortus TaxID=6289 RepID=A0A7I4YAF7_HAECO